MMTGPRYDEEIRRVAEEIEDLARPGTRSGDEIVRQMADRLIDRVRLLRVLADDIREQRRRCECP